MAEYFSISEIKAKTKKSPVQKELTVDSVRDSICAHAIKTLNSNDKSDVLVNDKTAPKTWYLTLKYGVVSVTGAKIIANDEKAAAADALSYIQKVKGGMAGANVKKDIETAFNGKKASIAKTAKKRKEEKAKIDAMTKEQQEAYRAEKKARREAKAKKKA